MSFTLRMTLICCLFFTKSDAAEEQEATIIFNKDALQKLMYIRILKRTWNPSGPSAETEEVMDEYNWDVNTAYQVLRNSFMSYDRVWIKDTLSLFQGPHYKKDQDSILIIHPMNASADVPFVLTTITALAMRNLHKKYNIFAVDMKWNNPQIVLSVAHVTVGHHTYIEPMADAVSEFFDTGIDGGYIRPEQIHLIGWSYSGQLVGYMARHIFDKYGTKISSILAMDPYANVLNEAFIHTSANDAKIVHIFHSNSLLTGSRSRVGTADFVYNDGNFQPECYGKELISNALMEPNTCSHMKVVQRLWYLILFPSKFVARKCPTWNHLQQCYCENRPMETLSYPIKPNTTSKGIYFIRTIHTKPYGIGLWGASCSSEQFMLMEFEKEKIRREDI